MHLFLKINRTSRSPNVFAWATLRAKVLGPGHAIMSEAEAGEFEFLMERRQHSCIGAGGQFEYRVYELADYDVKFPFAIIKPVLPAIRERWPDACRLINIRTLEESMLTTDLAEAQAIQQNVLSGRAMGSFGIFTDK